MRTSIPVSIFKINNLNLTQNQITEINEIETRSKIKDRIEKIAQLNGKLEFQKTESSVFGNNLILIDSALPNIIAESLNLFFTSTLSTTVELTNQISNKNPLAFNLETNHPEFFDANSPTLRVGGEVTKNFETVVHENRMYSLENSYSKEDLIDWENRIQKVLGNVPLQYTCELKYDGASISITYENGKLNRAVTRGDGFQGDDVTNNIKTIKSIPLKLKGKYPERFDIRGEIILPFEGFEKMNQELIEIGETPYSNPRNTASGSLKLQDSSEVAKRPLECLLYFIVGNNLTIESQYEGLETARNWGFKVPKEAKLAKSQSTLEKAKAANKNDKSSRKYW